MIFEWERVLKKSEYWGQNRVAMTQGLLRRTLDDRHEVPSTDSYFKAYYPSSLPLLTSYRRLHKTYRLEKKKNHNLNYAIRAAVVSLSSHMSSGIEVSSITVNFSESFTKRLEAMKNPVSYYGKRLKDYFTMLNVSDFFLVIEEGRRRRKQVGRRLHAHIVLRVKKDMEPVLKKSLQNPNEVYFDEKGNAETRCVDIEWGYAVKMFGDYMNKVDSELLLMEIEDYPEVTAWKLPNAFQRSRGIAFVKPMLGVDVGFADYLSKQLHVQLLKGSKRNYYISRSLLSHMKKDIEDVIRYNQIALNMTPK